MTDAAIAATKAAQKSAGIQETRHIDSSGTASMRILTASQ
jgi:hypothetical protein